MFVVVEGAVEIDLAGTVVERLDPGEIRKPS
jgi:hypothetical protein